MKSLFFFGFNILNDILGILMLPLAILAAWWTWKDANKIGSSFPWLWAGISFSIFPVGFIIYLVYRVIATRKKL